MTAPTQAFIAVFAAPARPGRPEAVWIVPDAPIEAPAPAEAQGSWLVFTACLFAAAALLFAAWRLWLRGVRATAPEEFAFRRLARRLGMRRDAVETLRVLAAAHGAGAQPVALLLSESAFSRGARRARETGAASGPGAVDPARLAKALFSARERTA